MAVAPSADARCRGAALTLVEEPVLSAEHGSAEVIGDLVGRIVAPVTVNGQGPYRFIIDTGANRSALSHDLARQLGLVSTGTGQVHTINEAALAPLVDVDSIEYAGVTFDDVKAPLIDDRVLAGEDGLLGVDGMAGRRLILDFENRCVEISDSSTARTLHGWTSVEGDLRFGHLMLMEGFVGRQRINVLIDTGSSMSLANLALHQALNRVAVREDAGRVSLVHAFNRSAPLVLNRSLVLPEFRVGDIDIGNITAFLGDFHIFELWGLQDQPTLLIGMDALSQAPAVAIDYGTSQVYFRLRRGGIPRPGLRPRASINASQPSIGPPGLDVANP
jgi:predicted aspartyl protease